MSNFMVKMHQVRFRLRLRPRPRWGSLQCSPDLLAAFKEPTSNREGKGKDRRVGMGEQGRNRMDGKWGEGRKEKRTGRKGKERMGGKGRGRECLATFQDLPPPIGSTLPVLMSPTESKLPQYTVYMNLAGAHPRGHTCPVLYFRKKKQIT